MVRLAAASGGTGAGGKNQPPGGMSDEPRFVGGAPRPGDPLPLPGNQWFC